MSRRYVASLKNDRLVTERVVLAWLFDRREKWSPSSGTYSALTDLAAEVRDGDIADRWAAGELDDLLPEDMQQ